MKNIAAKMVQIMAECAYVQKNGVNSFHGYKFATASDVLEKVNAAFVKHNVASVVNAELIDMVDKTNQSGSKSESLATVKTTVTLIDVDSGESITCVGLGSGADVGDKAVMKAQTASLKYAYLMSLAISSGDDPESDVQTDIRNNSPLPPEQKPAKLDIDEAVCTECGARLTPGVLRVSLSRYKTPLCISCQHKQAA